MVLLVLVSLAFLGTCTIDTLKEYACTESILIGRNAPQYLSGALKSTIPTFCVDGQPKILDFDYFVLIWEVINKQTKNKQILTKQQTNKQNKKARSTVVRACL